MLHRTGLLPSIILVFLSLKTLVFGTIDLNSFNIKPKFPTFWLISLLIWISGPLHGTPSRHNFVLISISKGKPYREAWYVCDINMLLCLQDIVVWSQQGKRKISILLWSWKYFEGQRILQNCFFKKGGKKPWETYALFYFSSYFPNTIFVFYWTAWWSSNTYMYTFYFRTLSCSIISD